MRFAADRAALRGAYRALYREPQSLRQNRERSDHVENLRRSVVLRDGARHIAGRGSGPDCEWLLPRSPAAVAHGIRRGGAKTRRHQPGRQRWMNLLEIDDLHVAVQGQEILKGITLSIPAGELHAVMGPNGSGKSTLSYALAGRDGYEVTRGRVLYRGEDLTSLSPDRRAALGVFLALQYPVEIPGVATVTFLKTALNAQRRARGEPEVDAVQVLKLVRQKAATLKISEDMLKRPLNAGFSGGEKK